MQWLGRMISDAWKYYWREFPNLAVILLLIWLPIELFTSYLSFHVYGEAGGAKVERAYRMLGFFFGVVSDGAIVSTVFASMLGKRSTPDETIHLSLSNWGQLLAGRFIAGLVILGGLILLIVPGLYCFVKLSFLDQVIINEKRSPKENLRRSFELTRGKLPHLIAIHIIYVAIGAFGYISASFAVIALSNDETWITEAFLSLVYDFAEAFGIVCMTIAYADLAGQDALNPELFGPVRNDRSIFEEP